MHCPICNAEYREGFTTCSDCGVELISNSPQCVTERFKNQNSSKDLKFLLLPTAKSVCISLKVIIFEIVFHSVLILLVRFIFPTWSKGTIVSGVVFPIMLVVNSFVIPIFLAIYNLKLNLKNRHYVFVINLLLIAITQVVLFIISYISIYYIDNRILVGYDRRQEVTGGMVYLMSFYFSLTVDVIMGIINQIILIIKGNLSGSKDS